MMSVTLNGLLRSWHGLHGMCAGLTAPEDILVLHVDRFVQAHDRVTKLHTAVRFCWNVQVPIFHMGQIRWETYQVIAAFSHMGHARGGHYQTLLKTFPHTEDLANPSMWLFCDDNRTPIPCLQFPPNFEEGVTGFWLVRSAQVELHQICPPPPTAGSEAILALLAEQPGCSPE